MSKYTTVSAIATVATLVVGSGAALASTDQTGTAATVTVDQFGRPSVNGTDVSVQLTADTKSLRSMQKFAFTLNAHCPPPAKA